MTVKECYEQMGSDYEGVLGRLGSEAIVKRFALKFLQDPSFAQLKESLAKNDGEEAFRAAHTLKGVCLNLGFDELFEVSAELTEKLREKETAGSEELFQKVSENSDGNPGLGIDCRFVDCTLFRKDEPLKSIEEETELFQASILFRGFICGEKREDYAVFAPAFLRTHPIKRANSLLFVNISS